jgi:hypothetical protein
VKERSRLIIAFGLAEHLLVICSFFHHIIPKTQTPASYNYIFKKRDLFFGVWGGEFSIEREEKGEAT